MVLMDITILGPAVLGVALGYILMAMFVDPTDDGYFNFSERFEPSWKAVLMFIAVALSAGLIAQYPESLRPFSGYALGIGFGVFLRELTRVISLRFFD
jgi:multidrug transporter EmrE-like cation transporter